MEKKFGKWLGGALGWAMGGPIGALVGFSVGLLWDNASLKPGYEGTDSSSRSETHPGDFAMSLLVLAAAVMKADNRILKSELNFVKEFLVRQFGEAKALELLKVLKELVKQDIHVAPVCQQIVRHMSHAERLQLTHFLIGIAKADGTIHPDEWKLINQIAHYLRVNPKDLKSLEAMYDMDEDRFYRILEIRKDASKEEIKSAYRRMAKKYHPDQLGDVGEDVKKAAVEKFRQVQEAYEKLYKSK